MPNNLSNRLTELHQYLHNKRRSQKELAEHFGVNRKTVCRAIDRLSQIANVSEEKVGRHTIYFIVEDDFNSPQFTPIELVLLC